MSLRVTSYKLRVWANGEVEPEEHEHVSYVRTGDGWLIVNFLNGEELGYPSSSVDSYRVFSPVEIDWPPA